MNTQSQTQLSPRVSKGSILLPLGILLIFLGIVVPRPLSEAAPGMESNLRSIALIATDGFRLCFLGGVGCIVIGLLRKRKGHK